MTVSFGVIVAFAFFGQQILQLPAHLAAGAAGLGRAAAPAGRARAADRQEPSRTRLPRPTSRWSRWARRCSPVPERSWRRWSFSKRVHDFPDFAAVALGVIGVHLTIWLAMRFSLPILRVIRESGVMLVTRISGLLLSAIAVQMVADAVRRSSPARAEGLDYARPP